MPAYKDKAKGTWYASFYYEDWTGKKVKKMKRGFPTKREAQDWERSFQMQTADQVKDMTFMLQKEVVMRMVAEPGTEEYGRLSVMLQYRFRMGRMFDVPPGAFRPAPKVMSSIVRMAPLPRDQLAAQDSALLGQIVTAAFGQRRKTLKNTLRDFMADGDFEALGIDAGLRGERLSLDQFVAIANHCSARAGH